MRSQIPGVPLGSVLRKSSEVVQLYPDRKYKQVTIRLWGRGVVQRNEVLGAEIAGSKRYVIRSGQFILSRIDARNGAFGLVPEALNGAVVSNDFPAFEVDRNRLIPAYLGWLSRTGRFVELCKQASEGTTNRVRLSESKFLGTPIPLPPVEDQHHIVARIEELVDKIEEARRLRREAVEEARQLVPTALRTISSSLCQHRGTLGQAILSAKNGLSRRPTGVESGPAVLRLADVTGGKISLASPRRGDLSSAEMEAYSLHTGDLLFVRVNGSSDIVGRCVPCVEITEPLCYNDHLIRVRVDPHRLDWRYVAVLANSPASREYMARTAITTAGQKTINQTMLAGLPLPVPPLEQQHQIIADIECLQAKSDALELHQGETTVVLDALLPSILDKAFKGIL